MIEAMIFVLVFLLVVVPVTWVVQRSQARINDTDDAVRNPRHEQGRLVCDSVCACGTHMTSDEMFLLGTCAECDELAHMPVCVCTHDGYVCFCGVRRNITNIEAIRIARQAQQ